VQTNERVEIRMRWQVHHGFQHKRDKQMASYEKQSHVHNREYILLGNKSSRPLVDHMGITYSLCVERYFFLI